MSRALPADLNPVVESRGPSVANPGLRVLRWIDWGSGSSLRDADEAAYLKGAVNLFKKQAKPESVLTHALGRLQQRHKDRQQALEAQGYSVSCHRAPCAGHLRLGAGQPQPSDPGLMLQRNLGMPYVPSDRVMALVRAGLEMTGGSAALIDSNALIVFDGWPVSVPRLESEWLTVVAPGTARELPADAACRLAPEMLSVASGAELEFCLASRDGALLAQAIAALGVALQAFTAQRKASADDEAPDVEIAQGPMLIPAGDGSGMIARASLVQYQVHNGRMIAIFRHSSGKEVRAEEHASNVAMAEEVRKRLAKKKELRDIDIEVEAVGNAWRIRALHG